MNRSEAFDVAIVGGGPAGSSLATLIKKYTPDLSVVVLERERFPRDHVGESLLPVACRVLNTMGCWDKVEAAGFPVKVGATFRWGSSSDLWDFDFLAGQPYEDSTRPAEYRGQRRSTAFHVDRSIFDRILLDHAESQGVDVRQQARVTEVSRRGQTVAGLILEDKSEVTARYYIDATGHSGLLRRALGIEVTEPSVLKNIAVWRYWQDAQWAVTLGGSATRIQVLSLGWGWLWIIPITSTRTSVGLVIPAEFYKSSGKRTQDIYDEALQADPIASKLLKNAVPEADVFSTKDWSFLASQMTGQNWFLVGEAAGFADPILSAGISLAMVGAQETAITIAELERGNHDPVWLKSEFEKSQVRRIKTHIMFADYWYTSNSHFTDLIEYTGTLAKDSGVALSGKEAWQWLGTGGFVQMGGAGIGGFTLASTKWLVNAFNDSAPEWQVFKSNVFSLNLTGASKIDIGVFHDGFIEKIPAIAKDNRMLPAHGIYRFIVQALTQSDRLDRLMDQITRDWCRRQEAGQNGLRNAIEALEAMVNDGWVLASYNPGQPLFDLEHLTGSQLFHTNTDNIVRS